MAQNINKRDYAKLDARPVENLRERNNHLASFLKLKGWPKYFDSYTDYAMWVILEAIFRIPMAEKIMGAAELSDYLNRIDATINTVFLERASEIKDVFGLRLLMSDREKSHQYITDIYYPYKQRIILTPAPEREIVSDGDNAVSYYDDYTVDELRDALRNMARLKGSYEHALTTDGQPAYEAYKSIRDNVKPVVGAAVTGFGGMLAANSQAYGGVKKVVDGASKLAHAKSGTLGIAVVGADELANMYWGVRGMGLREQIATIVRHQSEMIKAYRAKGGDMNLLFELSRTKYDPQPENKPDNGLLVDDPAKLFTGAGHFHKAPYPSRVDPSLKLRKQDDK